MCRQLAYQRVKTLVGILFCAAVMFLAAGGASGAPKNPPTLTVGYPFDEKSFQRRAFDAFVKGALNGKVAKLQPIPARKFGDTELALLDAARKGQVDLAVLPFEMVAKEIDSFGIFTTPFLFEDFRHLRAVQRGSIGAGLLRDLSKTGVRGVGWWAGEFVTMAGMRPAIDPDDLNQQSIAYQPLSVEGLARATAIPELSSKVGALPVPLPPISAEVLAPFSTADLVEATPGQIQQFGGAPRFITLTNHLNAGYVVIANPAAWNKLPSQYQRALEEAFDKALQIATEGLQRQEALLFQGAPGNAAVMALTAADRAKWREQTRIPDRDSKIGPLIAQVRDYPIVQLTSGTAPDARISWNTWLEDGQGKDVPSLTVGKVARINLDLGRLPYRRLLTATPDPRLQAALSSGEPVKLLVQPILLGPQIEAAPGQPLRAALMTVSLKNAKTQPTDEQKRERYWDGKISTRQLAQSLGLGEIAQWSIKANQQGCVDVAFAVWDEARVEPLDHIVISLPVQAVGAQEVKCYGRRDSQDMAAGLETMLRSPRTGRTAADLSLHIFEYSDPGTTRSVAVLVHAKRLAAAQSDPSAADPGVYSWELVSVLSKYANEAGQLPKLIGEAHQRVDTGKPFPYEDVAGNLASVLFAGRTERDADQATMAAEAFKDAVASGDPSRITMRLVGEDGRSMYLPIGLLAASATTPFVSKRFSVIQSLPDASPTGSSCIRSWHIARSATLQGAVGKARELLVQAPQQLSSPAELMTTHDAVAKYLASQPTSSGGEGFIMLAHHDAGSLRFSPEDRPPPWIRSDIIRRRFPAGSLGVLAACSTSGSTQQTSAIVERLASQGMSTIVLSPFPVDIRYGIRLALAFERQVLLEATKPTGATAAALFELSTAAVAGSLQATEALSEMSLEFQLVGDPDVTLCAEQGS